MDTKEQALEILSLQPYGVMGTVMHTKPYARIMTFIHDENLRLYTVAPEYSAILKQLESNPFTHILYGYKDADDDTFLEIEGHVEIAHDNAKKAEILQTFNHIHHNTFNEKHNVLLCITPVRMRIMHTTNNEPCDVIIH